MSGIVEIVGTKSDGTPQAVLVNLNGELVKSVDLYNINGSKAKTDEVTGQPRHLNDVINYTNHYSQGSVATAELSTINFTAGENVTAIMILAWSLSANFQGVYVTFNSASDADAATRLQSSVGATTATPRYFIRRDQARLIKLATEITRMDFVAVDDETTANNNIEIEPY